MAYWAVRAAYKPQALTFARSNRTKGTSPFQPRLPPEKTYSTPDNLIFWATRSAI